MSVLRRAHETSIVVAFTPLGTLIVLAIVGFVLWQWGVEPPVLWWALAGAAVPLLALDALVVFLRLRRGMDTRAMAREVTDQMWRERGRP